MSEHLQEMYEDMMLRRRGIQRQLDEGDEGTEQLMQQLNALNQALGDPDEVQDDLFDKWEREMDSGKVPDLDELPAGAF